MSQDTPGRSRLERALREPTVHFVGLALLLFGISSLLDSGGDVLEIDPREVEWRVTQAGLLLGDDLDEEQRQSIEDAFIEERVLVAEARRLGLDEDPRIDDVLVQKMLHVLSGDVIQPTEEELAAFYEENRARFTPEASVTVDELLLATQDELPRSLLAQLAAGAAPSELQTDIRAVHGILAEVTVDNLTAIFDAGIAERVYSAPLGEWVGPHRTVRGQHWLRVTERTEPIAPPLSEVREEVRLAWVQEKEEERLAQRVDELRSRYTVRFLEAER